LAAFTKDKQENGFPRASSRDPRLDAFRRGLCAATTMASRDLLVAVLATIAIHKGASIYEIGFRAIGEHGTCRALEARQEGACIVGRDDKSLSRTEKAGVD
jgi:hypothetical protein